MEQGRVD